MMILVILFLFLSIITHEVSHGYVAYRLGDSTPKDSGRLSFNPLVHVDMFGTLIVPLFFMIISYNFLGYPVIFGWAKPVHFNPENLSHPKRDRVLIALAGPFSNLVLGIILQI